MYSSRTRYSNGIITIALDNVTGRILELVNEKTGENYIKNSCTDMVQPFEIFVKIGERVVVAYGGDSYDIDDHVQLKPLISSFAENGETVIVVKYERIFDGGSVIPIGVEYRVVMREKSDELRFSIAVRPHESNVVVEKVIFPIINGVYLGESWRDDVLVFPDKGGLKIENPIETFATPRRNVTWKWQEYRYTYRTYNPSEKVDDNNVLERKFSGSLSMPFACYYDSKNALYIASYEKTRKVVGMSVSTYGETYAGMNFSFTQYPYTNEPWQSCEFVVALYSGDWHDGARRFRRFAEDTFGKVSSNQPEWFKKGAGLVAHYDFKYQGGGVVHKYADIPTLYAKARDLGVNHLLLAGWHKDGFDCGFPRYEVEEELGAEEELKNGVAYVKNNGGHVSFYMNSRLVNTVYDEYANMVSSCACQDLDGVPRIENYGNKTINFAVMCNNTVGWRNNLEQRIKYATDEIGIDGIYLDQIALAPPGECYAKEHGHSADDRNKGTRKLLEEVSDEYYKSHGEKLQMIHEGVSSLYGDVSCGLTCSFQNYPLGGYPEIYAYVFPEHRLVEAIYPTKNMAMRPVHVAQIATKIIDKTFVIGGYFWIYDLEEDCTFDLDDNGREYLKNALALTDYRLNLAGDAKFCDTDGVEYSPSGEGNTIIKRFCGEKYDVYACARNGYDGVVTLKIGDMLSTSIITAKNGNVSIEDVGRVNEVYLPCEPLCLVVTKKV